VAELRLSRSVGVSVLILVIIGLTMIGLYYRESQIPRYLAVTLRLSLDRYLNEARWADFEAVSVNLTASIRSVYDNVSLAQAYGNGSIPSHAYWRITIVLNQSESAPFRVTHDIFPRENVSGRYGGVVSFRFAATGEYTLWVIAYGVYKDSTNYLQSFFETTQINQGPLSLIFSIRAVQTREGDL
jgi:hypothetical protein